LLLGQAVEVEEVGVGADAGVEPDEARHAAQRGLAVIGHRAARGDDDLDVLAPLALGAGDPGLQLRQDPFGEVARRAELVADPAVADRAGEAGHGRAHRGDVDGDVGPGDGERPLVAAGPHRLLLAVEFYRLPGCALLPEPADVAGRLPHVAGWLAERN